MSGSVRPMRLRTHSPAGSAAHRFMAWSTKLITAIISLRSPISSLTCRSLLCQEARENSYTVCDRAYLFAGSRVDRGDDVHSLLGYFLLRPNLNCRSSSAQARFAAFYYRSANGELIIAGRCCSALSSCWPQWTCCSRLKTDFFPKIFLTFIP